MAASAVMSATGAQAGCQLVSTSFRKDSTSGNCGDSLDASSQPCFLGSPRSMNGLRRAAALRQAAASRSASSTTSASLASGLASMIPGNFMGNARKDDVEKDDDDEDDDDNLLSSSNEFLDTINNVIADVVDGQKFLKETGRTKPRPMKRRSLVMCLAMGAIQPYLSEIEDTMTSLRRTTSNSLAKTVRLVSQLSIGASRQLSFTSRQLSFSSRQLSFGKSDVEQLIPAAA